MSDLSKIDVAFNVKVRVSEGKQFGDRLHVVVRNADGVQSITAVLDGEAMLPKLSKGDEIYLLPQQGTRDLSVEIA